MSYLKKLDLLWSYIIFSTPFHDHICWEPWKRINANHEERLESHRLLMLSLTPGPNKPFLFLRRISFVKDWMVSRTPPAIAEAGGVDMWPKLASRMLTSLLSISHNSARTLFNMAAAGLRVHWMVKVACGICSSKADCSCSVTLACFSCCSAPGLFSEPNSSALLLILWTQYSYSTF